eukprot:403335756
MQSGKAFKLKSFVSYLSNVEEFDKPNIQLEQYMTPPDITANLFQILHFEEDALENKIVGDFCCGTGMYSIASSYFNTQKVIGFDVDPNALAICQENIDNAELSDKIEILNYDLLNIQNEEKYKDYFDTVVMNPPFGTKNNEGIDMKLLSAAIYASKGKVFSLHKESTSKYILKYVKENYPQVEVELMQKIAFDLPNTYKFHKKKNAVTEVVLVKIDKTKLKKQEDNVNEIKEQLVDLKLQDTQDQ